MLPYITLYPLYTLIFGFFFDYVEYDDTTEGILVVGVGVGIYVADMVQSYFWCVVDMLSVFVVLWHFNCVKLFIWILLKVCMQNIY